MLDALTGAAGSLDKITESFYQKTRELMITESWACVGQTVKNVDIVRDVLKYVPLYWACEVVCHLNGRQVVNTHDSVCTLLGWNST